MDSAESSIFAAEDSLLVSKLFSRRRRSLYEFELSLRLIILTVTAPSRGKEPGLNAKHGKAAHFPRMRM